MFPFCQPCTHAYRSSSSFNTTRWYSLFLFMWLWWRFQEGSSGPMGLVAVWPSADHCCGQRGRPCWKENLPWMDGVQLKQESSSWQPLLNKHGMMWWRTKGTHTLIFIHFPLPLICFSWCHLWVEIYISEEVFLYFFSQIPLLSLSFFPLSLSHFCGIFPSVHLSISLSCWIQGFSLCRFQSVRPQLRQI